MLRTFILLSVFLSLFAWNHLSAQEQEYQSISIDTTETVKKKEKKKKTVEEQEEDDGYTEYDKKWDWRNFRVGGNFGLSLGRQTYVEVSPAFGYWLIPQKLQLGVSSKFIYQSVRFDNQKWQSFLYGGGFFSDYVIWNGLFARGEFELINKESYFNNNRVNVPHLLIGGGYIQPAGEFGNFFIAAMFNVLDSDESIYSGTFGNFPLILRMGFGIGFPGGRRRN